ncbi:hypothetical protein ON05_030200 (plasmid) [Acaryochloris sp. CCMEE 5410]|nr:hypothetical protein ON05_030200 [Acaryochloris sp. CCMEE 5410]
MVNDSMTKQYQRALSVGLALSLLGELIYWVIWGLILFPSHPWITFKWSLVCGFGMGSVVGTLTCLVLIDRFRGWQAVVTGFAVAFGIFIFCAINCFLMDQQSNYWGAATHPQWFLMGGVVGAILGSLMYTWLVFTSTGSQFLDRGFWNILSRPGVPRS